METEEKKTELPAEIVAERERIRAALIRYINRTGFSSEINTAWEAAYPGEPLHRDDAPVVDTPSEAVLAERRRLAHAMVELAREESWCSDAQRVWRAVIPGVEFRDKDGYDCQGFNSDGKHRYDVDPSTRPAKPYEGAYWCARCRQWHS